MVTKAENDMRDEDAQKGVDAHADARRRVAEAGGPIPLPTGKATPDPVLRAAALKEKLYCNCCKCYVERSTITTAHHPELGDLPICPRCGEPESFTEKEPEGTGPVRAITAKELADQLKAKEKVDAADRILSMEPRPPISFEDVTPPHEMPQHLDTVLKCMKCSRTFRQWKYVQIRESGHTVFGVECPHCAVIGTVK